MPEPDKSRIVVVEDDAATRALLVRQLQSAGYDATGYGDGRTALGPIGAMNTGIVVADWSMPEMDGLELCRAVREMQGMDALGHIHFVLLTAHDTKDSVVRGLAAGANDYLTKPYHVGELLARIQVGERMLRLQEEAVRRNIELQKVNAEIAVLANKLEHLANTDMLTGLANRRRLFERFEEAWRAAEPGTSALSCIMLDVDRFKGVNDTYGHAAGDEVLQEVAGTIRRNAWRPELGGRFGGEEFVLILPATPLAQAIHLAETLRADIASRAIVYEGVALAVTVSCGVAEMESGMSGPDELIRCADAMLYLAKEHGRNQTWVCGADRRGYPAESQGAAPTEATPHNLPARARGEARGKRVQSAHANSHHKR